jgi:hypothetical protein
LPPTGWWPALRRFEYGNFAAIRWSELGAP